MNAAAPSCCLRPGESLTSFEDARAAALALAVPVRRTEIVPLADAVGRILAAPLLAPHGLPPFDQAAMDGYAIHLGGRERMPDWLPLAGVTEAGDVPAELAEGAAHGVMTGGALPSGADTVVMIEATRRTGDRVWFQSGAVAGSHIRRAGEDIEAGSAVARTGQRLDWTEIALLAALGIASVPVVAPIRIAVLTTGSELRPAGTPLAAGTIHDANGPMLAAFLRAPGIRVDAGTVADDRAAIAARLAALAPEADLVVTTAGMSVGARDHVRDAVSDIGGRFEMFRIAMKPGKPLGLGRIVSALLVGLPGNPQAVAAGALAFLRPMIAALAGGPPPVNPRAEAAFPTAPRPDARTSLVPVRLRWREGRLIAESAGPEGSHRLAPIAAADALAILPASVPIARGASIEVIPFRELPTPKDDRP